MFGVWVCSVYIVQQNVKVSSFYFTTDFILLINNKKNIIKPHRKISKEPAGNYFLCSDVIIPHSTLYYLMQHLLSAMAFNQNGLLASLFKINKWCMLVHEPRALKNWKFL